MPRWTALKNHMADPPPTPAEAILVVDDDADTREMLVEYLQAKGFTVYAARHGVTALRRAAALRPRVILMDLSMPTLDGLETTRRLRADANLGYCTIIAVTTRAFGADREAAYRAGCDFFIAKPYDLATLSTFVDGLMSAGRLPLNVAPQVALTP